MFRICWLSLPAAPSLPGAPIEWRSAPQAFPNLHPLMRDISSAVSNMARKQRLTEMTNADQTILEAKGLAKYFPLGNPLFARRRSYLKAVDAVDFQIKRGEILGLVGESGCGKTTVAKCILRLLEPTAGTICLEGKNILELEKGKLKPIRKEMQMIFQDPHDSLDPRMRIAS